MLTNLSFIKPTSVICPSCHFIKSCPQQLSRVQNFALFVFCCCCQLNKINKWFFSVSNNESVLILALLQSIFYFFFFFFFFFLISKICHFCFGLHNTPTFSSMNIHQRFMELSTLSEYYSSLSYVKRNQCHLTYFYTSFVILEIV